MTPSGIFVPQAGKPVAVTVGATSTANTSATPFGKGQLLAIQPDSGKVYAVFYSTNGQAVVADANSWPIAQNETVYFEMSSAVNAISFYNPGASSVTVMILPLARS